MSYRLTFVPNPLLYRYKRYVFFPHKIVNGVHFFASNSTIIIRNSSLCLTCTVPGVLPRNGHHANVCAVKVWNGATPRLSRSFVVRRSQCTKKTIHYQTISERWQEPKTPCTWTIRESYTNNGKNNARSCEKESYKIAHKNESHEGRKINALIKLSLRKFRHCIVRAKTMPLTIVSHWRVLFEYTYTRFYYMYVLHIVLAIWLAIQVRLLSCLAFVSLFSCCCCCYLDPFTDFAVFLLGMRMYRMDCEWISSMD